MKNGVKKVTARVMVEGDGGGVFSIFSPACFCSGVFLSGVSLWRLYSKGFPLPAFLLWRFFFAGVFSLPAFSSARVYSLRVFLLCWLFLAGVFLPGVFS